MILNLCPSGILNMAGSQLKDGSGERLKQAAYPLFSILVFLVLWQGFVQIANMPIYLLPAPLDILESFAKNAAFIFSNAKPSLYESIAGFLLSIPVGVLLAVLTIWSATLGRAVMPFMVFSQSVPKISIAPLLLVWFGFGMTSRVLIVFMMAFFPIFISMVTGLRSVDQEMLDMMTCMRPSKLQVFIKLRIPNSLPFLLDGLRLAVIRSVLAAVVAEWISSDKGLGYLVIHAEAISDSPLLFATVVLLATMGFGFFTIVTALGRFMVPWYFAMRKTEALREQKY